LEISINNLSFIQQKIHFKILLWELIVQIRRCTVTRMNLSGRAEKAETFESKKKTWISLYNQQHCLALCFTLRTYIFDSGHHVPAGSMYGVNEIYCFIEKISDYLFF
jgi:hypothetical protein